jgi:hypothetical protein
MLKTLEFIKKYWKYIIITILSILLLLSYFKRPEIKEIEKIIEKPIYHNSETITEKDKLILPDVVGKFKIEYMKVPLGYKIESDMLVGVSQTVDCKTIYHSAQVNKMTMKKGFAFNPCVNMGVLYSTNFQYHVGVGLDWFEWERFKAHASINYPFSIAAGVKWMAFENSGPLFQYNINQALVAYPSLSYSWGF